MEEEKRRGLFDIFKSLSHSKQLVDGDVERYEPFMTNRIFSHFPDTLFHANLMNLYGSLPKEAQMDYYLTATVAKSRFAPWYKPPPSPEELNSIKLQTGCSNRESLLYLELLEQLKLKSITKINKGGITK